MGYQADTLSLNPEHYWRHEEASGNIADLGAGNRTGTMNGSPTYSETGLISEGTSIKYTAGPYAQWNATTNNLLGHVSPNTGGLTFEFWTNVLGITLFNFFQGEFGNAETYLWVYVSSGDLIVFVRGAQGETGGSVTFTGAVSASTTYLFHVLVDIANDQVELYRNGVKFSTTKSLAHTTTTYRYDQMTGKSILGANINGAVPINGWLDEVAFYSYVMTPAQISSQYNSGLGTALTYERFSLFDRTNVRHQDVQFNDPLILPRNIQLESAGGAGMYMDVAGNMLTFTDTNDNALLVIDDEQSIIEAPGGAKVEVQDDDFGGTGLGGDVILQAGTTAGGIKLEDDTEAKADIEMSANTATITWSSQTGPHGLVWDGSGGADGANITYATATDELYVEHTDNTIMMTWDAANKINESNVALHLKDILELQTYTVAGLPTGAVQQVAYVSNGDAGSPCIAVHDGTSWKRISLGATVSAT